MVRRVLVAALVLASIGVPRSAAAVTEASCEVSSAPAAVAAALAVACGRRVEVAADRSAVREHAEPDGTRSVEIQSVWHGPGASRWAYAKSSGGNNETSVARVGLNPDDGATYRSFFEFPVGVVANTHILSATFSINLYHSWSCAATPVTAWRTAGIGSTPRTGWVANPFQAYLSTQSAASNKDACPTPATPLMSFPATGDVQAVANAGWSAYTVGLSARDSAGGGETTQSRWKKFLPSTAKLVINYNRAPAAPTAMSVDPASACSATPFFLNSTAGVTLRARLSDPDGDNVSAQWRLSGVDPQYVPPASAPAAGGPVSTLVPAAAFTEGRTYTWSVRGFDGTDAGPWGPDCAFTVNNELPDPPVATSTELALGTATIPPPAPATATAGRPAAVTLAPAPGDADIAGFLYGIGAGVAQAPSVWAPITPTGTVSVPVPPVSTGLEVNILTVRARDRAGQEGATATYRFRTAAGPAPPRTTGDVTGDGRGDVLQVRDVGGALTVWVAPLTSDINASYGAVRVFHGGSAYPTADTRWTDGDTDGDGRADLVLVRSAAAGRIEVSVLASTGLAMLAQPAGWDSGAADWDLATLQVAAADVTGDGRADVLLGRPDGVRVLASTPDGLAPPEPWSDGPVDGRIRAGDVTGDGRADLVRAVDGDIWVHASTGAGFAAATRWWDSAPGLSTVVVGDFTGSGADDVAVLGEQEIRVLASSGTALQPAVWWTGSSDPTRIKLGVTDIDGDSRADLMAVQDQGYARTIARMIRSTGTAFRPPQTIADTGPGGWLEWSSVGYGVTGIVGDLTSGASATASSSAPEEWNWSPRFALDGRRDSVVTGGWSSWSSVDVPHTEWFELAFPAPRALNRLDLYPRKDGAGNDGGNFPLASDVEVWTGTAWERVDQLRLVANPGATLVTSSFPARTTSRIRVVGSALLLMQYAEVEAYLVQ